MLRYKDKKNELKSTGKYIVEKDMTWGNAGNISARVTDNTFLITASGTHLGELKDDDFVECAITHSRKKTEDNINKHNRKPSKELAMHKGIYELRPDINAVIHASPFYSTLVSITEIKIPDNWFVEAMYYLNRVERLSYYHPGSLELAEGVKEKCRNSNIILLENHGVVVFGSSIKEARTALVILEVACKMLITANMSGVKIHALDSEIVEDFLHNSDYNPVREWKK